MRVDFSQGLVKRFVHGGLTGCDWGPETADRRSFFTLTDRSNGCLYEDKRCVSLKHGYLRTVEAWMAEGHWEMDIYTALLDGRIRIRQVLTCIDRAVFQDFVVRFKFDKYVFQTGTIGERTINHADKNIWYQYPVKSATLSGPYGTVIVKAGRCETAGRFRQDLYIRDEPGAWIVHVRLMPTEPSDLYWIRWSNRYFQWSLGDKWSRQMLRIPGIKKALWHLAERRGGRPAIQAQGLSTLNAGAQISVDAECLMFPK